MRLSELISYVRQIEQTTDGGERGRTGAPLDDDPNAPRHERRGEPPPWITENNGALRIRDRGDIVLVVEEGFSPAALPPDLQIPNPPIDESLAYYLPFHLHGEDWGIYLRGAGVLFMASVVKGSPLAPGDILEHGRRVLLEHELFHFSAEVACSRAEVVAKYGLYGGYFFDAFAAAHEEALANASALRSFRHEPKVLQERVADFMRHQGPGYRDFDKWKPPKFAAGCRHASQFMLRRRPRTWPSRPEPAEFLFDSTRRFKAPIYLVQDVPFATVLKPFPRAHGIEVLVHTNDHPPPHIHIEVQPGRPSTRCQWPSLQPLKGEAALSAAERRRLDAYIAEHGPKIDGKVRAVYAHVAPWVPGTRFDSP